MDTPLPFLRIGENIFEGRITPLVGDEVILDVVRRESGMALIQSIERISDYRRRRPPEGPVPTNPQNISTGNNARRNTRTERPNPSRGETSPLTKKGDVPRPRMETAQR